MSLANIDRSKLLPLIGVAAPITAVCVARVLFSVGPSEAPAAGADVEAHALLVTPTASPDATPEQEAALRFVESLSSHETLRSPMLAPPPPDIVPINPVQPMVELDDPTAMLVLTSIVGKGERALASIGNHIYRVGEEPLPGWEITSIDAPGRRVQLRHTSGDEAALTYKVENRGEN